MQITKKIVCYSTRKSSKWGVCSLWGSFDPPNGSYNLWRPTVCIDKVLMDVNEKIWHFWRRNSYHPKNGVLLHTKIVEMRRMLASGLFWPSKWVGQAVMANHMHRQGLDGHPRKNLAFLTSESGWPKNCGYSTRKSSKWGVCSLRARLTLLIGLTSRDAKLYA